MFLGFQRTIAIGIHQVIGWADIWRDFDHIKLTVDTVFLNRAIIFLNNRDFRLDAFAILQGEVKRVAQSNLVPQHLPRHFL